LFWNDPTSISVINTLISSANMTKFVRWIFRGRSFTYSRTTTDGVPIPVAHLF
jgi:hypothetical protein